MHAACTYTRVLRFVFAAFCKCSPVGLPCKWLASHLWHHSKQHIKTSSHFPCTRSILQAAAQETHQWHRSKHQIKTSHFPCYAPFCKQPLKKHISGIAASTKSKPAIPHADARFCKQPLKKHISGTAANTKSKPAIPHVDARFASRHSRNHFRPQWHRSKEQIKTSLSSLQACPRIPIDAV